MKKCKRMVVAVLLLFVLMVQETVPVQAELFSNPNEIRVGLTSMYTGKDQITIYNTKLGYGYCVNHRYLQEMILESSSGFSFVPVTGYFVAEKSFYGSYQAASQAAKEYKKQGVEAYPGSCYQCSWRVYFGSVSKYSEGEALLAMLEELTGKSNFELLPGNNYRIEVSGTFGKLLIDVEERYAYPQFRAVTANEKGVLCVNLGERIYRGRIEIGRYGKSTLTAVNVADMEDYLYGVVPSEMSPTWHEEALKAQAVCARSFALIKAGYGGDSNAKKGYKIVDTVSSQVYKGYLAESVKANRAVDATKGEMLCYNNKVVAAYYFSTSGGRTESSKEVWGAELPYLQSVPDLYEQNAEYQVWQTTLSLNKINSLLKSQGITNETMDALTISAQSENGRVSALKLGGTGSSVTLQGTTIRTILNLPSTKFKLVRQGEQPDTVSVLSTDGLISGTIHDMYVASAHGVAKASEELEQYIVQGAGNLSNYPHMTPQGEDEILFAGMGYGHGVGLSQYGAKGMAEAGYTYKEILEYYFTGASVR